MATWWVGGRGAVCVSVWLRVCECVVACVCHVSDRDTPICTREPGGRSMIWMMHLDRVRTFGLVWWRPATSMAREKMFSQEGAE